jgi:phosphoserine aminotransferase
MTRAHNFCAGPCTLPVSVLQELSDEMVSFGDSGMSVIEMSHRGPHYEAIHYGTIDLLRRLYAVPDGFEVLLLQGGASLAFAMIPMNLVAAPRRAGYVLGGTWGRKAFADGAKVATAYAAWTEEGSSFTRMPTPAEVTIEPDTAFLHVTSNETIEGTRMPGFDGFAARLVADMSSDYLSRPLDWSRFDLVYGGAQKNLGPAGLTVVFVRSELVASSPSQLPSYLRFDSHASSHSLFNTPPVFSIWAVGKMLAWMEANGGVGAMEKRAAERSGLIYDTIEASGGFYRNPVEPMYRSHTNVVFRLPSPELEHDFAVLAEEEQLLNLLGHRSVGGIRASIYNGMATESVEILVSFMQRFAADRG